jgi:hypothetical protein
MAFSGTRADGIKKNAVAIMSAFGHDKVKELSQDGVNELTGRVFEAIMEVDLKKMQNPNFS